MEYTFAVRTQVRSSQLSPVMPSLPISAVELGFLVALFPSISMLLTSFLLFKLEVSSEVEASFQNFSAGLILSAVAGELFPLLSEGSQVESVVGEILGFGVGLAVVYGVELLMSKLGEGDDPHSESSSRRTSGDTTEW